VIRVKTTEKLIGFAMMKERTRKAIAARGGAEAHRRGTAHTFTRREAQDAVRERLKRSQSKYKLLPSRVRNGRYEYFVADPDGQQTHDGKPGKWMSRQAVHQRRQT
jgi:hypothetical protein